MSGKPPVDPPPSYEASSASASSTSAPPQVKPPLLPRPPPLELPSLADLRSKRVILASSSPRRKQILSHLGLPNIETIPSTVPENFPKTLSPWEYVLRTAQQKAQVVYAQEIDHPEKGDPALIIAADTVVVDTFGTGDILEKPRSQAQHISMLKRLRDAREHKVFTAIAVMAPLQSARDPGYALETHVEETSVRFDASVTDELILSYVKTREGADKAGGYALQGLGSILVEKIDGSWDNVVGLPLRPTLELIEKVLAKGDDDDILPDEMEEMEDSD
ncbi:septum formation protein Maf [Ascosphaera apis ARSEF 7405]|uniref:Septum formation protein Maf n=1 Tax=Ascosphaera apis ARSEF 7405 TaxID=392613 RepID=A0A167UZE5_9EURO|nr:septum formation protein Maf [Ascosphaera apis ARSEF 7405]